MKRVGSILWGIVFIAAAVILALNAFGVASVDIFFDGWWTLFIIVPCVIGLITDREKTGSIIGICIGVFLLLCCQDVIGFDLFWKLIIPVIIGVIGIKMIVKNLFVNKGTEVYKMIKESGTELKNGTATFSGVNMNFAGEVFEGAELNAVFGGVKCDLRNAVIEKDCVINASAIFGGIDIYVPENLNVKITSTSVFGGVSDKNYRKNDAGCHTLYIYATCLFGGVEVK
ncbi:MAG: LiaF transmembrane domain-containing protein [Porcipelethomonas sp.]